MVINLIFPTEDKNLTILQNRIDTIHYHMIMNTLNSLELPYNEKLELLEESISIISHNKTTPNWMQNYNLTTTND